MALLQIIILLLILIIIYLFTNLNDNQLDNTSLEKKIWIIANLDINKLSNNSLKNIIVSEDITPILIAECENIMINNNLINILLELYQKSNINIVKFNTKTKILKGYKWEDNNLPTIYDKTKFILDNSISVKYLDDINNNDLSSNQILTFIQITDINKYNKNNIDYNKQESILTETIQQLVQQNNKLIFSEEEVEKKKENKHHLQIFEREIGKTYNKLHEMIKEKIIINPKEPDIQIYLPIDCEMSIWSDFGKCSSECGGGIYKRTRKIKTNAEFNEKACSNILEEVEKLKPTDISSTPTVILDTPPVIIDTPTVIIDTPINTNVYNKVDSSTINSSFIPFFTSSITTKSIENKKNNCYCKSN